MRVVPVLLALVLAACASEELRPATQVLVVVASDLSIGDVLSSIRVSVQDQAGTPVSEPFPLALAREPSDGRYTLPLSFGVVKAGANTVRAVVTGFGPLGPGGAEIAVIQQKALITFQTERTLRLSVFLGQACVSKPSCPDEQVCYPEALGDTLAGECGPIPAPSLDGVKPGDELSGLTGIDAGAGVSLDPVDAGAPAERDSESVEASAPDANTSDGGEPDACATATCGTGAQCEPQGASYRCSCPGTGVGDPVRACRSTGKRLSASDGTCILRKDGSVWCWGIDHPAYTEASPVAGLDDAIEVAAGGGHGCALRSDGTVVCWGSNEGGQLGDGSYVDSLAPVSVRGLQNVRSIESRAQRTCAITSGGAVHCWGSNAGCALGNCNGDSNVPIPVPGVNDARALALGLDHVCAVLGNGGLSCWGNQLGGALGNGMDVNAGRAPFSFSLPAVASAVALGDHYSCALAAGDLYCWGRSQLPSSGAPLYDIDTLTPSRVRAPALRGLVGGGAFQCGLAGAAVVCRGANGYGQLGDGSLDSSQPASPTVDGFVQVSGLSSPLALSLEHDQGCTLGADERLFCWGRGAGPDGTVRSSRLPVEVTF